jgi:hypothetical protein
MYWSKSTDQGSTWSTGAAVIGDGTQRPYCKFAANGDDRIDVLCTDGHPDEVSTNSIYHAYYQGGAWYKSDGTAIGHGPPFLPSSDFTRVFDGSTSAGNAWVWDLQVHSDGSIGALFARFPTTGDHRYVRALLNAGAWTTQEVCSGGGPLYTNQPRYSGGVCFGADTFDTVYASCEVASVHQMFKYTTADSGSTWTGTQITGGGLECFRPFVPAGTTKLLFAHGSYISYTEFTTDIRIMDCP